MVRNNATLLDEMRTRLGEGDLLPYLGPGLLQLTGGTLPDSPSALANALGARVRLPARVQGNLWAAAQFIENRRFRATLDRLMSDIFAAGAIPSPLHEALARLRPPLIVDTWYDATMRHAFAQDNDWAEVQGAARIKAGENRWVREYDATGQSLAPGGLEQARTVLYKPHGSIEPGHHFLLTDADYVEVLTEIDIQSPIPDVVKQRRRGHGFLFLGCRFDDQTLRIFARQILKRSAGRHVAVFDNLAALTRNEWWFLEEIEAIAVECPIASILRHFP